MLMIKLSHLLSYVLKLLVVIVDLSEVALQVLGIKEVFKDILPFDTIDKKLPDFF